MSEELCLRTKQFALRIIRLVRSLPENDPASRVIGYQLLKSGTSIGANYRSALRGRSDKDFISRISIAEEEADETVYWLEILIEADMVALEKVADLHKEAKELTAIMTSSGKTKKRNMQKLNRKVSQPNMYLLSSLSSIFHFKFSTSYLLLKSPRFHAFINSFQAKGFRMFMGGVCPA